MVVMLALPNIIWILWPPSPNALKGNTSSLLFIEYGGHILCVLIVVMLLFLMNKSQTRGILKNRWAAAGFVALSLYWLCWMMYFAGVQAYPVIYAMVALPPIAFFSAGAAEKVWPISAASVIFLVFHLVTALENFPI